MKHFILLLICCSILLPTRAPAETQTTPSSSPMLLVSLHAPAPPMQMGDVPTFTGKISNKSMKALKGIVVYLSLVSLQPGMEHPVDLEDWSAEKAVRIDHLAPGESVVTQWKMRLIKSGPFGAALTTISPSLGHPHISPLAVFSIAPKPTVLAGRILPVAVGIPLLLAGLFIFIYRLRQQAKS
jgi:hypothetical protein